MSSKTLQILSLVQPVALWMVSTKRFGSEIWSDECPELGRKWAGVDPEVPPAVGSDLPPLRRLELSANTDIDNRFLSIARIVPSSNRVTSYRFPLNLSFSTSPPTNSLLNTASLPPFLPPVPSFSSLRFLHPLLLCKPPLFPRIYPRI